MPRIESVAVAFQTSADSPHGGGLPPALELQSAPQGAGLVLAHARAPLQQGGLTGRGRPEFGEDHLLLSPAFRVAVEALRSCGRGVLEPAMVSHDYHVKVGEPRGIPTSLNSIKYGHGSKMHGLRQVSRRRAPRVVVRLLRASISFSAW